MRLINKNIFLILLIIFFTFLFFFRLGDSILTNWDEAWFGSIARVIVRSHDWIQLTWNNYPFFDHPPLGYWLMALSYKLFGISEFSTRFPSALLGLFSIILIYKIANELFNKKYISFISALILGSSVWYVIRVRSGNLDSIFVFFYLLTVFLALKSSKNIKLFPLVGLSVGGLILTKTLAGISVFILIIYLNCGQLVKVRKNLFYIVLAIIIFLLTILPWYIFQLKTFPGFFQRHFIETGMRNKSFSSFFNLTLAKPFYYLHMGLRKWFYLWLFSLVYLILQPKFLNKKIAFLFIWNFVLLYPYLTSQKTELWHLIPVYLPISLLTAYAFYELFSKLPYRSLIYLIFFGMIFVIQVINLWPEAIPKKKFVTDEIDIVQKAAGYKQTVVLDEEFLPQAVFYSGRNIVQINYYPNIYPHSLIELWKSASKNIAVISRLSSMAELDKVGLRYKILDKNSSYAIISK